MSKSPSISDGVTGLAFVAIIVCAATSLASRQEPEALCPFDFEPIQKAIETGDVTKAHETLMSLLPQIPEAVNGACRVEVESVIEGAMTRPLGGTVPWLRAAPPDGEDAGEVERRRRLEMVTQAALGLLRAGRLIEMGNVLTAAQEPQDAGIRALDLERRTASEAQSLFDEGRYDAALRAAAKLIVHDPFNLWARDLLPEAVTRFREQYPDRTLRDDGTLGMALLLPARTLAMRGEIRQAWTELERLPLDDRHAGLSEARAEVRRLAETKARQAVWEILKGERESAIPKLEDAAAALFDRASVQLYLALAYHGSYLKGRENDGRLEEKAREAIERALVINPDVSPPPKYFSPRFLALLEEVRHKPRP